MANWTKERLEALSVNERAQLYTNALKAGTDAGDDLAELIREAGLPYSDGSSVNMNDPLVVKMHEIIFSEEGRSAARKAAEEGLPALAGVDLLIAKVLGVDYGSHNQTTNAAGSLIADLMREMGFREAGRVGTLPPGSVAKSAQIWIAKTS